MLRYLHLPEYLYTAVSCHTTMAGARRITTAHVLHLMILLLLPTFLCRSELARERVRANIRGVLPFSFDLSTAWASKDREIVVARKRDERGDIRCFVL